MFTLSTIRTTIRKFGRFAGNHRDFDAVRTLFQRDNRQKTSFLGVPLQNAEVRAEVGLVGHEMVYKLDLFFAKSMSATKCGTVVFGREREFEGEAKLNRVEIMNFKQLCTQSQVIFAIRL